MKPLIFLMLFLIPVGLFAQSPYQHWQWAKSFGGNGNDSTVDMKIKNGYLYVTGVFSSPQVNWENTTLNNQGGQDIFIAKLDTNGNTIWVKQFGGTGDDAVYQMEINNAGTTVVRCTSASSSITIGTVILTSPENFYLELDADGNLLNGKVLPVSLVFTDIDIDQDGGVYTAATFSSPFLIGSDLIDTSLGGIGTCVLKYDNTAQYEWVKSVKFDVMSDYGPIYSISFKIEYNNADSVITIFWDFRYFRTYSFIGFGNNATNTSPMYPGYGYLYVKLDNSGRDKYIAASSLGGSSISSAHVSEFETGNSGLDYLHCAYHGVSLNIYNDIIKWQNRSRVKVIEFVQQSNNYYYTVYPFQPGSLKPNEDGNYLMANGGDLLTLNGGSNHNLIEILDSNLNRIIKAKIPDDNNRDWNIKCMADTNAVYLANEFNKSPLLINENIPLTTTITLANNGASDIFIGKYTTKGRMPFSLNASPDRFRICADSVSPNLKVNNPDTGSLLTYQWQPSTGMSDAAMLNPKVFLSADSLVSTLTISDNHGYHYSKTFVFYRAAPLNFHLVVSPSSVCTGDTVTLTLQGTDFIPCLAVPNQYNTGSVFIHSINQVIKYQAEITHSITLYDSASRVCIGTDAYTVSIKPIHSTYLGYYVCPGIDYTFPDNTTVQNIQSFVNHFSYLNSANGCDSIVHTQLYLLPRPPLSVNANICSGTSYTFPDGRIQNNITADVTDTSHLFATGGCDSITIYTNLSVKPSYTSILAISLCPGSNYIFPDGYETTNIVTSISHSSVFSAVNGCDSSITTNITVNPSYNIVVNAGICSGSSYTFPDGSILANIVANNSHISNLHTVNGCDSLITTNLTVSPVFDSTVNVTACSGSSYTFPDGSILANIVVNNSHISNLHTVNGCDSLITTNLTVSPVFDSTVNVTACSGTSYTFPDNTSINNIQADISHVNQLVSINGCDSIITSNLHVIVLDTSITKNRATLQANLDGAAYQWLDCTSSTSIATATAQSFVSTSIGSYAVQLLKDGCIDTSSCYAISFDDLLRLNGSPVTLYPVPVSGMLTIEFISAVQSVLQTSFIDGSGRVALSNQTNLVPGVNRITFNVSGLQRGLYSVVLHSNVTQEKVIKKIVIN